MSNIIRMCLLAFASASVACGAGADEPSSSSDPVAAGSSEVTTCPKMPPREFHHCPTLDEMCSYPATNQCFRCAEGISSTAKSLEWVSIPCPP
jgi:hypothetical protein